MICTKCNIEIADGSSFCPHCGVQIFQNFSAVQPIAPKTSGLAIAALVLGILSFFSCGLLIIPAMVCGIIAAVQISNSRGRLKGMGMAIMGIVSPAIAIPIIALLMGILMPALVQVRLLAQTMMCGENLKAIGNAMILYADENNGQFPTPERWCDLLIQNADIDPKKFICPSHSEGPCSYAMNVNAARLGSSAPEDMVLVFESKPDWNLAGGKELLAAENHRDGVNIVFVDGTVEFVRIEDLPKLIWDVKESP
ncbi:MAG: DUF4190 domain-containing protein [Phycisphaerae bacterium]